MTKNSIKFWKVVLVLGCLGFVFAGFYVYFFKGAPLQLLILTVLFFGTGAIIGIVSLTSKQKGWFIDREALTGKQNIIMAICSLFFSICLLLGSVILPVSIILKLILFGSFLFFSIGSISFLFNRNRQGYKTSGEAKKKYGKLSKITFIIILIGFAGYGGINLGARALGFRPYYFGADDMFPTIKKADKVVVYKKAYRSKKPEKGDLVVLVLTNENKICVRRIAGLPGEEITQNGKVIKVPQDNYYVLADNENTTDSRKWGFIPSKNIIGEIVLIYTGTKCTYNKFISKK